MKTTRRATAALLFVALLGLPTSSAAWGFAAHRWVNRKAVATLPGPLRALFAANADYLAEHSIDPDLWRAAGDTAEGPSHYLDMDAFGVYPFDAIPRIEAEHLAKHGREAGERGRVPWRTAEVYRDLVAAFRERDPARILRHAAVLGHYVGDAHVPLHSVLNYDGQLTDQAGVHGRWEADLFERFERQLDAVARPSPARRVADPVAFVFAVLIESNASSRQTLASDRASAGERDYADSPEDDRYDDAYYSRLYEREGPRLAARLGAAATGVGSLWLSAWEEAGRPPLDASFRFPYVRRQQRAMLVSLDGSSAPVFDDAVARGLMPNLARLRRAGSTAGGAVTCLPVKTAAAHATLYTGAWPDRHGITGNWLALPEASVLAPVSGYLSDSLRAEPIWVTAARQGLEVTTLNATQTYPFTPYLEEKRFGGNFGRSLTLIEGYNALPVEDAVLTARELALRSAEGWSGQGVTTGSELEITVAGVSIHGLLYDDPADPVAGLDTLALALQRDLDRAIRLKPREADATGGGFRSLLLPAKEGELGVHFRLFELSPDGSEILLYRAEGGLIGSNRSLVGPAATGATGGFIGNGASCAYERGALGPPLWAGGDGTAEKRYLETVELVARQLARLAEFGVTRTRWQLLLTYLPFPDEFFHLWLGRLDSSLAGHHPALAARLQPFLDQGLRIVDGHLGELMRLAGDKVLLAVAADHGLVGANRSVLLNVALERAGLLALDPDGKVDLSRTQVIYPTWNPGFFLINRVSRKGGIVGEDHEEDVQSRLVATLKGLADPETGNPIVTEILDPRTSGPERGLGGPHGGDLFFNLAWGYDPSGELGGSLVIAEPPWGTHLLDPERREAQAAFAIAGPGVAVGEDLGTIRQIDVAPTLCALLGIDAPAQAIGRVLDKALARPAVTGTGGRRASRPRQE